jgi:ketosteroid isomerase-like protein
VVTSADEVLGVLERFRSGWESNDIGGVLGCFADTTETVVIGTDEGEYWRGHASLVAPFQAMGAAFKQAQYRWQESPSITVAGDVAWADGVLDTALVASGVPTQVRMRTSFVLRRRPEGWRVVLGHFSVAAANQVAAY